MIVIVVVIVIVIVIVIICNESMYISSHLVLPCFLLSCLVLSCLVLTSITIVIIGMTLYELVLHYIIISYHISCSFIVSLLLIWSPFHLILFYFILLNSIYYIVQYNISYQWMICVYLSVRPSVCLSVCMNKFLSYCLSE